DLDHPRPRGRRRPRRPSRGDVRRTRGRGRPGRHGAGAAAPSLYARTDRVGAEPQRPRRAAQPDSRHGALPRRPTARLRLRAALSARRRGVRGRACDGWPCGRPRDAMLASLPLGERRVSEPIIALEHVSKHFVTPLDLAAWAANLLGARLRETAVRALDDVNFAVDEGEVVGLVGESGCGKSTLGRIVAGVLPPSAGSVKFHGRVRDDLAGEAAHAAALKIQMIFQDPMASLNPRLRVADIVGEAPVVHGIVARAERREYVAALLKRVGLDPRYAARYPHQFSGGQRARIGIARALAVKPDFLVCDESVAALDVSIQAQILNLFMELRRDLKLTYLFISHDLGVVEHLSDRVVIMYLGRVVEIA